MWAKRTLTTPEQNFAADHVCSEWFWYRMCVLNFSFDFRFMAFQHILGHLGCGQLS